MKILLHFLTALLFLCSSCERGKEASEPQRETQRVSQDLATQRKNCGGANTDSLAEIVRHSGNRSQVLSSLRCFTILLPRDSAEQILLTRLDRTLREAKVSDGDADLTSGILDALSNLSSTKGFDRVTEYFGAVDWEDRRNQEFFDALAARQWHRPELVDVFYAALVNLPPSSGSALSRACQLFNTLQGTKADPKYVVAVLRAIVRVQQSSLAPQYKSYTVSTCEKTFLSQLLDTRLRESFLNTYGRELTGEERVVLNRFLQRLTSPSDSLIAQQFLDILSILAWDRKPASWQMGTEAQCDTFRGYSFHTRVDDLWGFRWRIQQGTFTQEYYFYPSENGAGCTLQKVRLSYATNSKTAHKVLVDSLNKRIGTGVRAGKIHEFGAAYWSDVFLWQSDGLVCYAFINAHLARSGEDLPLLEILARTQHLVQTIQDEESAEESEARENEIARKTRIDRLVSELRPWLPELAGQLTSTTSAESILDVLVKFMSTQPHTEQERELRLFLADLLAEKLLASNLPDSAWHKINSTLAPYGVAFTLGYDGEEYNHAFMKELLDQTQGAYWYDEAFLWYLSGGWYRLHSGEDPAEFLRIIERAERFLRERPNTHIRLSVVNALARAHETGWSLSRASDEDLYVERSRYLEQAEFHRKASIQYYQLLMKEFPRAPESTIARERVRRLQLGFDTNSRAYYYIWD